MTKVKELFLDLDVSALYAHSVVSMMNTQWTFTEYTAMPPANKNMLDHWLSSAKYTSKHPGVVYANDKPPIAVAHVYSSWIDIQEELDWLDDNDIEYDYMNDCPSINQITVVFYDWPSALAFKLAFAEKNNKI